MSFWNIIKGLNFKQLISISVKFFKHPLFMFSTIEATLQTFKFSQKEFPGIHGKHNKANAFRHALWNVLIAKKCTRFSKNQRSILHWTKEITDWHEEFSPNEKIAKAMDLHNNQFGRDFYSSNSTLSVSELINQLKKKLEKSILVNSLSEVLDTSKMVYLE